MAARDGRARAASGPIPAGTSLSVVLVDPIDLLGGDDTRSYRAWLQRPASLTVTASGSGEAR